MEIFFVFPLGALLLGTIVLLAAALKSTRYRLRLLAAASLVGALLMFFSLHLYQWLILDEPLAAAAVSGDLARTRSLLDRGASPDAGVPDDIYPALYGAACGGHLEVVELLLTRGADPHARSRRDDGESARQCAERLGHTAIAEAITAARAARRAQREAAHEPHAPPPP